jgi:Restriction endonuclease
MLGDKTVDALMSLRAAGPRSFENLIGELLGALTGQAYHLSASGRQGRVDGVAATGSIGFQAKRYKDRSLDLSSLLGDLDRAARARPDLELWMLVTTRHLPPQVRQELSEAAAEHGIAFLALAAGELQAPFHPVAGLCAIPADRTCEVLQDPDCHDRTRKRKRAMPDGAIIEEIRGELRAIAERPEFTAFRERLRKAVVELPTWTFFVAQHNQRVKRAILQAAKAEFGSHFDQAQAIRRTVQPELDRWLAAAQSTHQPPLGVILGESFDGKTWVLFGWLVDRLDALGLPVFLLSSARGDTPDRLDQILAAEVERSLGGHRRHARALLERHRRWAAGRSPWCLLLLDGLNEYTSPANAWYRHLSDALARSETELRPAAVMCTVRKKTWPEIEADVQGMADGRLESFLVGPYNDDEFQEALRRAGKRLDEIGELPDAARRLIRRPRFLQLVIAHPDLLANFELITEDVLYWLDVTDKIGRTRPSAPEGWSEERYQGVLTELARRLRPGQRLGRADAMDSVASEVRSQIESAVSDLISEGVIEAHGSKYTVCAEHLQTAMGLYLLDLVGEPGANAATLRERIRDLLAPYNEDDAAAAWLRRASVFAVLSAKVPDTATDVLIEFWGRPARR